MELVLELDIIRNACVGTLIALEGMCTTEIILQIVSMWNIAGYKEWFYVNLFGTSLAEQSTETESYCQKLQ